jgi:hypothetical protein
LLKQIENHVRQIAEGTDLGVRTKRRALEILKGDVIVAQIKKDVAFGLPGWTVYLPTTDRLLSGVSPEQCVAEVTSDSDREFIVHVC